jgi:hypothetical protein
MYYEVTSKEEYLEISELLESSAYEAWHETYTFDLIWTPVLALYEDGVYQWIGNLFDPTVTKEVLMNHLKELEL